MPPIRYHVALDDEELRAGFEAIRAEVGVPPFPPEALDEAEEAAARGPVLPPGADRAGWEDRTELDLVAIDPPGSLDLDQAYGAERRGDGYRVHYAIADLAAFVAPGGALEAASLERGVTLYGPDRRESLHPEVINEDAASLVPGQDRPSVLWTIDLDGAGRVEQARLVRATVHVAEAISYRMAQTAIGNGDGRESLRLLAEIGNRRQELERERGAVSLSLPAQEIARDDHGHSQLVYDDSLPVENWNAQISLLTGMVAADIMLDAVTGILRTLPPPDGDVVAGLRRTARGLDLDWPDTVGYAERLRGLDPADPREVTLLVRAARALRGAGYVAFTEAGEIPEDHEHSAIAAPYAHVTAPLRRVCDRYANEVLLAICAERHPPGWALHMLPALPSIMGRTRQREQALERAMFDYMEAKVLEPSVGAVFDATVVNHRRDKAIIQLREPAVIASLKPKVALGEQIRVRLVSVDPATRHVRFERVD